MKSAFYFSRMGMSLLTAKPKLSIYMRRKNKISEEEYKNKLYSETNKFAKKYMKMTKSNITVHGLENLKTDKTAILMPNHQSMFDVSTLLAVIDTPIAFISKKDVLKFPVISTIMLELNCLTLDRDNVKEAVRTVVEAIKLVKNGQTLVIFPEGTRSKNGEVGEFKEGAFKIAKKANAPIIPITIDGTFDIFEKNIKYVNPSDVTVTIHEPIETENLTKEELALLPITVREIVISALNKNLSE